MDLVVVGALNDPLDVVAAFTGCFDVEGGTDSLPGEGPYVSREWQWATLVRHYRVALMECMLLIITCLGLHWWNSINGAMMVAS